MNNMLNIESNAHHILVVLDDCNDLTELSGIVNELAVKKHLKRLVIHVMSSDGKPTYLSKLRSLLQSVVPYTLIVRFEGVAVEDLFKVIKRLPKDSLAVVCSSEITDKLDELGVEYVVLGDN